MVDLSHDDFLDTVEMEEPAYLECKDCDKPGLPPRKACPDCGSRDLVEKELSRDAEVVSYTEIHIPTPMFEGEAPFTVVVAEFKEGVRLTGQLRGAEEIEIGDKVRLGIESRGDKAKDGNLEASGDERLVTFTPE